MKIKLFCLFLLIQLTTSNAQNKNPEYSLLFYNVENLFDVSNDPLVNDDAFTPGGERNWNRKKLNQKLLNISKTIISAGEWNMPIIIGLCEIENSYVLELLLKETPLKKSSYGIIHKDSPDHRGIDVALLYDKDKFYPLEYEYYPLVKRDGTILKSREILYASGIVAGSDTLHVFVNHWPSRYGGVMETRGLRNLAANVLRENVDIVLKENKNAKIVIMGDFNDQPSDKSIAEHLGADEQDNSSKLFNLSNGWNKKHLGTLKYKSQWFVFDQFIVSSNTLNSKRGLYTRESWAKICDLPFLFQNDAVYGGKRLSRSYHGFRYEGGFSDHLPIILNIRLN